MTDLGQIFSGGPSATKNQQVSASGIADAKKYGGGTGPIKEIADGVTQDNPTIAGNPEDPQHKDK